MIDPFFLPRMYRVSDPPEPASNWALFLDLDGTLLDIAQTPDAVVVPDGMVDDLSAAARALDGALAIVSGRLLAEVDQLLAPLVLPAAGEHGAVIRLPDGSYDELDCRIPYDWIVALLAASKGMTGVQIERKAHSVVAHYRLAPKYMEELREISARLVSLAPESFEILEAKMAIELRPRTVSKARAVNRLMQCPAFKGRLPVFVGDDLTDDDGFKAAEAMGGLAIDVFQRFAGRPKDVRDWLKRIAKV